MKSYSQILLFITLFACNKVDKSESAVNYYNNVANIINSVDHSFKNILINANDSVTNVNKYYVSEFIEVCDTATQSLLKIGSFNGDSLLVKGGLKFVDANKSFFIDKYEDFYDEEIEFRKTTNKSFSIDSILQLMRLRKSSGLYFEMVFQLASTKTNFSDAQKAFAEKYSFRLTSEKPNSQDNIED